MTLSIAQSTPTGAAIAALVTAAYPFGEVVHSELLRRSFNQVYGLRFADGRRAVARLSAERPRGAPDIAHEAALLAHLRAAGVPVADCLRTRAGACCIPVPLPEGERPLSLFEHLDGEFTGEDTADVQAFGRGLAALHAAAQSFRPDAPGRYVLESDYLLQRPLQRLLDAPTMADDLRPRFVEIASRLQQRIDGMEGLSRVVCHGDAHGQNNFITTAPDGQRVAAFFDFDEAGPGYLAYELAVYPWSMHPRSVSGQLDDKALARWQAFMAGYRLVRALPPADLQAVPAFMAVRQFWLLGEYAGRVAVWGSQAMPTAYLRRQAEMLTRWETLALP